MKALLCTLNSKYIHSCLAPWCLFSACTVNCKGNIKLKVFEGTVNENQEKLPDKILLENADVITFSCYIWNIEKVLSLCEKIKESKPETIIILGGPEVAYRQRNLLENNSFVDFVLSGEGELILPKLLDCLYCGLSAEEIDGVSFRKNGNLIIKNELIGEYFDYPSPYCQEYFASLNGRITYIESSRGCPFNCAYCLSGRCGKVKFKSIGQTKKEILLLAQSGTKTVKFIDRTFNCDNSRAIEILRFIRENIGSGIPEGVCFHFEINADILKESFIKEVALFPKGAVQFEIGIQSTNPETLESIGRRSNKEKLFSSIVSLICLGNCHIHTDLIAGLPLETFESFTEGFNECYTLGANMLQLGFLKLLHGSPLKENGYCCTFTQKPPYEVTSTPTMNKADFEKLHIAEKELDRLHNSGRFSRTLTYLFEATGLSPFDLFYTLGKKLPKESLALDLYTNEVFCALCEIDKIDAKRLKDVMLYDRLASNNSGVIPKSLYRADKNLKTVKHILSLELPLKKGTKRSVGILYTEKKVIFCDYGEKDTVTDEYAVKELRFDFFGETFFNFDIDK